MQRLLEAGARHGGHMCGAVIPRRPPASRGGAREPARPRRRRGARGARWRTEVGRSDGRRSEVGGRRSEARTPHGRQHVLPLGVFAVMTS